MINSDANPSEILLNKKTEAIIDFCNPKVEIARLSNPKITMDRYFTKLYQPYLSHPTHPDILIENKYKK